MKDGKAPLFYLSPLAILQGNCCCLFLWQRKQNVPSSREAGPKSHNTWRTKWLQVHHPQHLCRAAMSTLYGDPETGGWCQLLVDAPHMAREPSVQIWIPPLPNSFPLCRLLSSLLCSLLCYKIEKVISMSSGHSEANNMVCECQVQGPAYRQYSVSLSSQRCSESAFRMFSMQDLV